MRKAGDVCFAEVSRDSKGTCYNIIFNLLLSVAWIYFSNKSPYSGTFGLVDYTNYDDICCKLVKYYFRTAIAC